MYRFLTAIALSGLAFTACKPTPRNEGEESPARQEQPAAEQAAPQPATEQAAPEQPAEQPAEQPTPQPAQQPAAEEPAPQPAAEEPAPQAEEPAATAEVADFSTSLLTVAASSQDYNLLRPWEKRPSGNSQLMGVYLGEGKVLTLGGPVMLATYVEIGLPDNSRSVPAKVLRVDRDLNLALLTVEHDKDLSIFDTRTAVEPGSPLKLGDKAEFWGVVRGLIPLNIAVTAESSDTGSTPMPRLNMRTAQPVPSGSSHGFPIVSDGRLVGMTDGYQQQILSCINAEFIARFLAMPDGTHDSCPVIGFNFCELNDPVFRAYLKLADEQGGVYVSSVLPGGAAEAVGIQKGDVVTAIDGLALDSLGRCQHPLYGAIEAGALIRMHRPLGDTLTLSISRDGQMQDISVPLNRDALMKDLLPPHIPGEQPRYVMWGGLLFQPLTSTYLNKLRSAAKSLPLQLLQIESRREEFREKGVTQLVALTQVIPTPATLSYDNLGYCLVEAVNGKPVHNFDEFIQLLDEPTENGLVAITLNKAPYTIYVDRQAAEASNETIRRTAIPQLRK